MIHEQSDGQSEVREKLSEELVKWLKLNPPNEVFSQPPTESEFNIIQDLYSKEKSMDD
jgi:hypothetical protein